MSQPKFTEDSTKSKALTESPVASSPRDWEKGICDCSHWLSGGCLAFYCCMPCSLCCCLPHSLAAMARKINWVGFSDTMAGSYETNRKRFVRIIMALFCGSIVFGIINGLLLASITHDAQEQALHATKGVQLINDCEKLSTVDEQRACMDKVNMDIGSRTTTALFPYFGFIIIASSCFVVIILLAKTYLLFLRYNMRRRLNIRPSCITACGDVGGAFEDSLCLSACLPCALSQMHEEMNVEVSYFCGGADPGYADANLNSMA